MRKLIYGHMAIITIFFVLVFIFNGCSGISVTTDNDVDMVLKKVAISAAAKALGENMARNFAFEWTDTMDGFLNHVSENGLSVDGASIIGVFLDNSVPSLYRYEAEQLASLVGFKVTATGFEPDTDDFEFLMVAINGFREGVLSVTNK